MKLLILILSVFSFLFGKKPAPETKVILEDIGLQKQIAYHETGEKGKAGFNYLKEGNYTLSVQFPQQEGKWIKEKKKNQTLAKASYNKKNRTYYYQGIEGYFAIKFDAFKRIEKDKFKSVFKEEKLEDNTRLIRIAEFRTRKNGARIELQVKAITAKKFKKKTIKIHNEISTISIQGIK